MGRRYSDPKMTENRQAITQVRKAPLELPTAFPALSVMWNDAP